MNKGVIQQVGTPTEIYYHPVSEFVADFIGEANFLEGVAVGIPSAGKLQVETEHQRYIVDNLGNLKQSDEVKLVLRPESVHLDDGKGIACKVEVSTFMPPLFGLLVKVIPMECYPYYLMAFFAILVTMSEGLNHATKERWLEQKQAH